MQQPRTAGKRPKLRFAAGFARLGPVPIALSFVRPAMIMAVDAILRPVRPAANGSLPPVVFRANLWCLRPFTYMGQYGLITKWALAAIGALATAGSVSAADDLP